MFTRSFTIRFTHHWFLAIFKDLTKFSILFRIFTYSQNHLERKEWTILEEMKQIFENFITRVSGDGSNGLKRRKWIKRMDSGLSFWLCCFGLCASWSKSSYSKYVFKLLLEWSQRIQKVLIFDSSHLANPYPWSQICKKGLLHL